MRYETRPELLPDRHELPSRFWEPGAEEREEEISEDFDFDFDWEEEAGELPFI